MDVQVLAATNFILMCRIGRKFVGVLSLKTLPGTDIARRGDRGRLILPRDVAAKLGLCKKSLAAGAYDEGSDMSSMSSLSLTQAHFAVLGVLTLLPGGANAPAHRRAPHHPAPHVRALLYVRDGDAYVVIASNGGAPQHPGWFHNLTAQPDVEIQVGRARIPVRAQVAAGEERSRLWARADEVNQASTPRTNPVRAASSRSWCSSRAERSGPRLGTPG